MKQTANFHEETSGHEHSQEALQEVTRGARAVVQKMGLANEVGERAMRISEDATSKRLCRFFPHSALAAAAVYIACRELGEAVTLKELAESAGCDVRDVGRCYAVVLEGTHITRPNLNGRSYLHRIAIGKPLPDEVYRKAEETITRAHVAGLNGRNPMTVAAAALYLASCDLGEKVTQSEAAEAAGVAEESVRECCKAIRTAVLAPPQIRNRTRRPAGGSHVVRPSHR
jgi:transcription initiation factor TFIIB